jgi:hypothetical protein
MKKMIGVLIATVTVLIIGGLLAVRIKYVNENARCPLVNEISQGERVVFKGIEYEVVNAQIWDYTDFFNENNNLDEYKDDSMKKGQCKILVVECIVNRVEDEANIDSGIPLEFFHSYNNMDPFVFAAMNTDMVEGTLKSGDKILMPYEIYRENLTDSQWELVENGTVDFKMVLGEYPQKNEMLVNKIKKIGEGGELD